MKKYKVVVNGVPYEVELEELNGSAAALAVPAAPAAAPAAVPADGVKVTAPIPGTILGISVAVGDSVKRGQVLMVLEAMKLENEINSPCGGKVVSIHISKGSSVSSGDLLCVIQ